MKVSKVFLSGGKGWCFCLNGEVDLFFGAEEYYI